MRTSRMAALGASVLVLLSACATGGGATSTPTTAPTVASALVFGGPPECPNRPFCLQGLEGTYGLHFKEFKPLDVGGPTTVAALESGDIQVALLFSSDPTISDKGFVVLADDKGLQRADNLTPVVNSATLAEFPEIADLLNAASAKITQDQLVAMNKRLAGDEKADADVVAGDWIAANGLLTGPLPPGTKGPVTVGKTNFYEQDVLSEIYKQILENAGFTADIAEATGTREIVFPTLENGTIDILPEYLATALEYVNGGAGQATADAAATAALFRTAAASKGITVLDPAPASDQNAIVVAAATATQYGLAKISDLGKPLP